MKKKVRRRVTGVEVEWPIGPLNPETGEYEFSFESPNTSEHISNIILNIQKKHGPNRGFLYNGARCYDDSGWLEWATGEEDTLIGTVASEYASEQTVDEAIAEYCEEAGITEQADSLGVAPYQLLKRSFVDTDSNCTAGYHMNLCADATAFQLTPHDLHDFGIAISTMSMLTGAGGIFIDHRGDPHFTLAQKPLMTKSNFHKHASNRPLMKLDNESHGGFRRFHRLEVIALDPNIAPWSSWMQFVIASLSARVIEQGIVGNELYLHRNQSGEPLSLPPLAWLARKVALDTNYDTVVNRHDGRTISTIDMQWELLDRASRTEHTAEEARGLIEWERGLTDLKIDGHPYLSRKNGYFPRRRALERAMAKHGLTLGDELILGMDRKWDALGERSIANTLRNGLWYDDMPLELIEHRRDNPCPDTRAAIRSDVLKNHGNAKSLRVAWSSYRIEQEPDVYLPDPLMNTLMDQAIAYQWSDDD